MHYPIDVSFEELFIGDSVELQDGNIYEVEPTHLANRTKGPNSMIFQYLGISAKDKFQFVKSLSNNIIFTDTGDWPAMSTTWHPRELAQFITNLRNYNPENNNKGNLKDEIKMKHGKGYIHVRYKTLDMEISGNPLIYFKQDAVDKPTKSSPVSA